METRRPRDVTHILRADPNPPTIGVYKKLAKQPVDPQVLADVVDWVGARALSDAADRV